MSKINLMEDLTKGKRVKYDNEGEEEVITSSKPKKSARITSTSYSFVGTLDPSLNDIQSLHSF